MHLLLLMLQVLQLMLLILQIVVIVVAVNINSLMILTLAEMLHRSSRIKLCFRQLANNTRTISPGHPLVRVLNK